MWTDTETRYAARRLRFAVFAAAVIALASCGENDRKAVDPTALPLVEEDDISYLGAFRMPNEGDEARLGYGGRALGYNPTSDSLFIGGHTHYQRLCEVSIPTPVVSSTYDDLPLAEILQVCTDVTEGTLATVSEDARLKGSLVHNGRLIVTGRSYYDADCNQTLTHGANAGLVLSEPGDFSGFDAMDAAALPRALAGYMGLIPGAWQPLLGGPALTGYGGGPIISCSSSGGAATVFDPDQVGAGDPLQGETLLNYPDPNDPLVDELFFWLNSTTVEGIAFPEKSRSVLFVGTQGETRCYGTGEECGDPCSSYKGTHSYPYHAKIWAFDANDLLAVKNGEAEASIVEPYGIWILPELEENGCATVVGATFDPATGRLFIAPAYGEQPLIHVYQVE